MLTVMQAAVCYILLPAAILLIGATDNPIAETKYGKLRGANKYLFNKEEPIIAFENVPYAKPPVGKLRFERPQQLDPWEGVKDATSTAIPCPQHLSIIKSILPTFPGFPNRTSESDCLVLNIYTPSLTGSHPVLVFIHGGGFQYGFINGMQGTAYAGNGVVLVAIQYRLGVFGFLYSGDGAVSGNMGLWDQQAALVWVKKNIKDFGGDPDMVTISGESAGSMSVSAHMLSPHSKGLFRRAICQSGSYGDGQLLPVNTVNFQASKLAAATDCPAGTEAELLSCLRGLSSDDLLVKSVLPGLIFQPYDDKDFFPANVKQLSHYDKDVDLLAGVVMVEGYLIAKNMFRAQFPGEYFNKASFKKLVKQTFTMMMPNLAVENVLDNITTHVHQVYIPPSSVAAQERDYIKAFSLFLGDMFLSIATYWTALQHKESSSGSTYFYQFEHPSKFIAKPSYITADHADDLFFTFGITMFDNLYSRKFKYTETDRQVDKLLLTYWSNFVKTGNPNSEGVAFWPEFDTGEAYMRLKSPPEVGNHWSPGRVTFWTETLPDMIRVPRRDYRVILSRSLVSGEVVTSEPQLELNFFMILFIGFKVCF